MTRTIARIAAAAAGLTLICMLFAGSFIGALHRPAPHRLPVGVAGPPAAARRLGAAFDRNSPGAFTVTAYPGAASARRAVGNREADAVLVPGPGGQRLLVAGAAGRFAALAATAAFRGEAAAAGQHLTVTDIRPLPPGDQNGISPLFMFVGLALPSAAFGIALASVLGGHLGWPARLAALASYSVLAGLAAAWVADGLAGALAGAPAGLAAVAALTAFAVSTACSAAWRLAGPPLAAALILLFVPVGVPAAGGPFGTAFVTSWYAHLGAALPAGAAMSAIRGIVFFGGHALAGPLLVLGLWAAIAAAALALPPLRRSGRPPALAHHAPAGAAAG